MNNKLKFKEFYETHYVSAKGFCYQYLKKFVSEIEDLVQDAFLKFYHYTKKHESLWEEERRIQPLFYKILKHCCFDFLRKVQNRKLLEQTQVEDSEAFGLLPITYIQLTPDIFYETELDSVETKEKRELLRTTLSGVPPKYREAFILQLSGYSIKEIAAHLQIKESTTKSRIHRAKTYIKDNIWNEKLEREFVLQ